LLVHSANNYAVLLARLTTGSSARFISLMNATARTLHMVHTRYVDVSGYDPGSVSTARDQLTLVLALMKSPVVRPIVALSSVVLPDAGRVGSYTPDINNPHVIGVKSGRTAGAGGCDAMAYVDHRGTLLVTTYVVVLLSEVGTSCKRPVTRPSHWRSR
jgi:D-alanyl-D-alanine carboxypeptidase (penicillin-binding protein 5/6)